MTGVGGVRLRARAPERLAQWYEQHLGIDPLRGAGESSPTHHVRQMGQPFRLMSEEGVRDGGGVDDDVWTVGLTVPDLAATVGHLQQMGIDTGGIRCSAEGSWAELRDPEGNLIRLWQPPEEGRARSSDSSAVRAVEQQDQPAEASETTRGGRNRWRTWVPLAAILVAIVAAVVVIEPGSGSGRQAGVAPDATSGATASRSGPVSETAGPVRVIDLGHPLFGITADWELFAAGMGTVLRFEFAEGRITRTRVPELDAGGPVSLVTTPEGLVVQERDEASGYVVPDGGRPGHKLDLGQSFAGPIFPGPRPGQVWIPSGLRWQPSLVLLGPEGEPTGVSLAYPANEFRPLVSDRRGNVLFSGVGGVYLASPRGWRKVAEGRLLAVGPTRLLTLRCDVRARCFRVVIDRATGERHVLPTRCVSCDYPIGVISPDGSMAAVVRPATTYRSSLWVIDLATGQVRRPVRMRRPYYGGNLAWSPDGRWLFAASRGALLAIDTRTFEVHRLDVSLPPIGHVAIRPASPRDTG